MTLADPPYDLTKVKGPCMVYWEPIINGRKPLLIMETSHQAQNGIVHSGARMLAFYSIWCPVNIVTL